MNTTSESLDKTPAAARRQILVWDAPVRVFHWLMVLSFAGAWLTAESERWRQVHVTLGYTMAALVAFRLLWGLFGTRHARFSSFVRGPSAVARYVRNALKGCPEHHTGHNPAGAVAIVALLLLTFAVGASGWAHFNDIGGHWMEEAHETAANLMLLIVGVHLAGVIVGSFMHRENLVRAMITGRKAGAPGEAARSPWRSVAVVLVAAVVGFWALQWQASPSAGLAGDSAPVAHHRSHDGDDD